MSSYGVFEIDLFIKGKKFTHPVNVIEELNENIIGIDFIHAHKLTYCGKIRFLPFGRNPDGFNVEAPSLFKINLSPSTFNYLKVRQQADSSCMTHPVAGSVMTNTS